VARDLVPFAEVDLDRILRRNTQAQRFSDNLRQSQEEFIRSRTARRREKETGIQTFAWLWQCRQPKTSPQQGARIRHPLV
jgi:hypothetical protein